jgi:HK97 family phage prohead protease
MPKFILSDESVNVYGFRVLTSGINIEDFKKNPVMFFNHQSMSLPIGKWNNIQIENGQLTAEPEFDTDDELAQKIAGKVNKGMLNAASIGFDVYAISDSPKDLVPGQSRPTVTKSRVFEASIAGIPGNSNALKLSFQSGLTLSGTISSEVLNAHLPQITIKEDMKKIALCLGLPEDATEDQILLKLNNDKAATLSKEGNTETGIKALVALAEPKGFKKEHIEKLAKSDFESTLSMVLDAQVTVVTLESTNSLSAEGRLSEILNNAGKVEKPSDERAAWTLSDWEKKDKIGLTAMIKTTPEKYQKLMFEKTGQQIPLDVIKSLKL